MSTPEKFKYDWSIKRPTAKSAYKRLEEICESYQQGIETIYTNNNIPYLDYMLRREGFLEFDHKAFRIIKVTPTEKALEIYNQNIP